MRSTHCQAYFPLSARIGRQIYVIYILHTYTFCEQDCSVGSTITNVKKYLVSSTFYIFPSIIWRTLFTRTASYALIINIWFLYHYVCVLCIAEWMSIKWLPEVQYLYTDDWKSDCASHSTCIYRKNDVTIGRYGLLFPSFVVWFIINTKPIIWLS